MFPLRFKLRVFQLVFTHSSSEQVKYGATQHMSTVYVGKIPANLDDLVLRKLLECSGKMGKWTRMTDPETGQLKKFGFCEFLMPDGALRALRLIPQVEVDGN